MKTGILFILIALLGSGCLRREQPERFTKILQASPKPPALTAADSAALPKRDTMPTPTHRVIIESSKGTFTLELYGHDAPVTVENFIMLAKKRLYDKTLVHRIAKDLCIQAGDPKTKDKRKKDEWGTGGESSFGEPFADELNPDAPSFQRGYKRGTVAMANRGPNTNTSQFFICLRDVPELPTQYTIFGMVTSGMNTVDSIAAEPIQAVLNESDGKPVKAIVIKSVRISPVHQ
jgi:cyclophilin family peptidyl-prolyl cis-trans isomerase